MNNPFLRQMPTGIQAILLVALSLICVAAFSLIAVYVASSANGISVEEGYKMIQNPDASFSGALKWIISLGQVAGFLLPALIIVYLFGGHHVHRFLLQHPGKMLLAGPVYLFFSDGWVLVATQVNEWLIPAGSWLEQWAMGQKEAFDRVITLQLENNGSWDIAVSVLLIAILPAICEEIFFRGTLQPLLAKATKNVHIAIWSTAVIFSLFHMEVYGFLPRVLMGAILGYLVIWSGSLWTSIITHLANNLLGIIILLNADPDKMKAAEANSEPITWVNFALSFALFGLMTYYLNRISVWDRIKAAYLGISPSEEKEIETE